MSVELSRGRHKKQFNGKNVSHAGRSKGEDVMAFLSFLIYVSRRMKVVSLAAQPRKRKNVKVDGLVC
ncbi:predicted protein [Botrytis cinerea T4]|uniref:Uncharacterized protein n=1 Tax=Botryotinia fuckeliana (strain T4) TaxID=999810 RepID=G2Y8Y3_BOTF4|nr:predicted protein [Botrytis cinerea T4]